MIYDIFVYRYNHICTIINLKTFGRDNFKDLVIYYLFHYHYVRENCQTTKDVRKALH